MGRRSQAAAEEALQKAALREAFDELRCALRLRCRHRRDDALERRRSGPAVEQRERVRKQDAARGRRRVGEHDAIAVRHLHGLARDRSVAGEILELDGAAARAKPRAHRFSDLPAVEGLRAELAEAQQGLCELLVAQQLALAEHALSGRPQRRALRGACEQVCEDSRHVGLLGVEHNAVARQPRCRSRQLGERPCPPALHRLAYPRRRPVHATGGGADVEDLHGVPERHVDRLHHAFAAVLGAAGRLREEVEQGRLAPAASYEHVAACAEAGEQGLRHERGQHRGDRGVDGVTAVAQHARARLGGEGMARCDDALLRCAHGAAIAHSYTRKP